MDVKFRIPLPVFLALLFLLLVSFLLAFGYGVAVQKFRLFPYKHVAEATTALQWFGDRAPTALPWYYREAERVDARPIDSGHPDPDGLNLVASLTDNDRISLTLVNMQGATVHTWNSDVFDIWPDPDHLLEKDKPKTLPGSHIHGMTMMSNGDVVFNFNDVGTVRMDACSNVVWRLPKVSHHSIYQDEDGSLWISGRDIYTEKSDRYPLFDVPRWDPTVMHVSPDGEVLREISIMDMMHQNGLDALLLMRTATLRNTVKGDNLHLNDVVTFPTTMEEGIFKHGDVMVSLRNIHTVIVFDPDTLDIRYIKTGDFIRQHDADFLDGNTISVFDNNFVSYEEDLYSRIVSIDARDDTVRTLYTGTDAEPFFTRIMGKQQFLADGRILISEPIAGRAFEVDASGAIIWEYINKIDDTTIGVMEEVQRIPAELVPLFDDISCP